MSNKKGNPLYEPYYADALKVLQAETDRVTEQMQLANEKGLKTLSQVLQSKIYAYTAAMTAVKKQIPMEVPTEDLHYDYYVCPACFNENDCDEYDIPDNCCPECGQRIFSRGVVLEDEEQW